MAGRGAWPGSSRTVQLDAARDELMWFFAAADGQMGLVAQKYDARGGGVWDEFSLNRLHRDRHDPRHRATVDKYRRARATLASVAPEAARDLRTVYVPFGAARASWRALSVFLVRGRQLLGLALDTDELRKASGGLEAWSARLKFVEDEVARMGSVAPGEAVPRGHVLAGALRAADAREVAAVTAYEAARVECVRADRRERQAFCDKVCADLHRKLWGIP